MDMEEAAGGVGIQKKHEDNQSSINSQGSGVQPNPNPNPNPSSTAIAMTRKKDTEIESGEDANSCLVPQVSVSEGEGGGGGGGGGGEEQTPQEKKDCVIIDVKHGGVGGGSCGGGGSNYCDESSRAEKVCRICHMSSSEDSELIQLGCGCKNELGVSHPHCAQTWFKHKGNRQCEICGKTAKNITGIQETRIITVEWNEMRLMGMGSSAAAANLPSSSSSSLSREGSGRCRPSFCNFLLACLVLAFILPWFFRVDML